MYNFFRDRDEYIIDAFRCGIDTRRLDFEIRTYLEKIYEGNTREARRSGS